MESEGENTSMIPQEVILLEILPKLPVKSLCQFKSVSKLWNSTISTDPSFLKPQLSHSSSTGLTFLITFKNTYGQINIFVLSAKINPNNEAQMEAHYKFTRPILFFISQSLQGLNLIHLIHPESVVIANTATHQFITLPSPGQEELSHWDIHSFGFDPVRSQHKVLNTRVIYTDILNNEDEIRIEHMILSLSQFQWRLLDNVPAHIPDTFSRSICIDEFVYYLAMLVDPSPSADDRLVIPDDERFIIVEFDVSREKFDFIELPDPIVDTFYFVCYVLVNYCNGLGLVESQVHDRDGNDRDNILNIWILGEGEKGDERRRRSWVNKKFKIPVDLRRMNGMNDDGDFYITGTVQSTGEVIILNSGRGNPYRLNLYNLETNCVRKIEISELPKDLNPYHCTVTGVCDHVLLFTNPLPLEGGWIDYLPYLHFGFNSLVSSFVLKIQTWNEI